MTAVKSDTPAPAKKAPAKHTYFGPTFPGVDFPKEMRRQLWPLCCGASIISGFKDAYRLTEEQLIKQINETILDVVPDFQVFSNEVIRPKLTFLTLNNDQMHSNKIMKCVKACGFVQFAVASPRGTRQGFFVRDDSGTFKSVT
jgi:hypothetical protein